MSRHRDLRHLDLDDYEDEDAIGSYVGTPPLSSSFKQHLWAGGAASSGFQLGAQLQRASNKKNKQKDKKDKNKQQQATPKQQQQAGRGDRNASFFQNLGDPEAAPAVAVEEDDLLFQPDDDDDDMLFQRQPVPQKQTPAKQQKQKRKQQQQVGGLGDSLAALGLEAGGDKPGRRAWVHPDSLQAAAAATGAADAAAAAASSVSAASAPQSPQSQQQQQQQLKRTRAQQAQRHKSRSFNPLEFAAYSSWLQQSDRLERLWRAAGHLVDHPRDLVWLRERPEVLGRFGRKLLARAEHLAEDDSVRPVLPPDLEQRQRLGVVVIGHVDAGKSTLLGHLLVQAGKVDQRLVHKYSRDSQAMGKGSFKFAWVLDQDQEERARGITVEVATHEFRTPGAGRPVTVMDAPGHRDFVPNMISGSTRADAAVLVVPATPGEFESSFIADGQTREHAVLARSLGINQIIVAVNKLDSVDWDQARYDHICAEIGGFLRTRAGYRESQIHFLPLSGLAGVNLSSREGRPAALESWWPLDTHPCLCELLDRLQLPGARMNQFARLSLSNVFKDQALGGTTVAGKLEAGVVLPGDCLLVRPGNVVVQVRGIYRDNEPVDLAVAGETVELSLRSPGGAPKLPGSHPDLDARDLEELVTASSAPEDPMEAAEAAAAASSSASASGYSSSSSSSSSSASANVVRRGKNLSDWLGVGAVLCDPLLAVPLVRRFQARLLSGDQIVTKATSVVLFSNVNREPGKVGKLLYLLDRQTGEMLRRRPPFIPANSSALVQIKLQRAIPLELFSEFREFGRFTLRSGDQTLAMGIVTKLLTFGDKERKAGTLTDSES